MACIIYKGLVSGLSFDFPKGSLRFENSVPSYVPNRRLKEFLAVKDFHVYDPIKHKGRPNFHVFVTMPREVEWFFSALRVLDKIQKNFPTCIVEVCALPEYSPFLKTSRLVPARNDTIKYYREFNLTSYANAINNINIIHLKNENWTKLLLDRAELLDIDYNGPRYNKALQETSETLVLKGDDFTKPYTLEIPKGDKYLVIRNGNCDANSIDGKSFELADEFKKALPKDTEFVDYSEEEDSKVLRMIAQPWKGVISCGDSSMVLASLLCGHTTMAFVRTEVHGKGFKYLKDRTKVPARQLAFNNMLQYNFYDNFVEGIFGGRSFKDTAKELVVGFGDLPDEVEPVVNLSILQTGGYTEDPPDDPETEPPDDKSPSGNSRSDRRRRQRGKNSRNPQSE